MTYISESLRRQVRDRAKGNCEYCLLNERYGVKQYEVDHVRAEKHGGLTVLENLCLSCFDCNHFKGSDLSSVDPLTDEIVALFNPRRDVWTVHFRLNGPQIEGLTPSGRVTVKLLQMNTPERILRRFLLMKANQYPQGI